MTSPAVSVLMPVLNPHPAYFPEAVASVLGQTFADWELVIVEDPSPASAAELLKRFDDPRIRLITNPARTGFSRQLNRGLGECRGEWVARLDADDLSRPDRLAEQLAFLKSRPAVDVLGTRLEVIDPDGNTLGFREYPLEHRDILDAMTRFNPVGHPSVVFRRSVVLAAGGYHDTPHAGVEDYELWCRLAKAGAVFATHPRPLLRYRLHPQAMKATKLRETIRGSIALKRQYWGDALGVRGRVRLLVERALLCMPAGVVLRCFRATQLGKRALPDLAPAGVPARPHSA